MKKTYNKFNLIGLAVVTFLVLITPAFLSYNDSEVVFQDQGLEAAIRREIGKEEGPIYLQDVDTLQVLDARGFGINRLEGIESLNNLRKLDLEDNFVKDVSPLRNNLKLRNLNLRNNEIIDLQAINFQDIIHLHIRDLNLRHNVLRDKDGNAKRLEDISLLAHMTFLRELSLRDNHVEDLSPLSNLRNLRRLDLRENRFTDIEALRVLNRLEELNLRDNDITSIDPLKYLHRLEYLNIHSLENMDSLEALNELHNLETLIMRNVRVEDNSFLANKFKLQRLNAIDTGLDRLETSLIESLLTRGALQGDVRPYRLIKTLEKPKPLVDSGFYTEAFSLVVETSGDTYYTLDGSEPKTSSEMYTGSIEIPEGDNNSATIVRLKTIGSNNTESETISRSYFVNEKVEERFTLPVFSIVTDPENLFDEGIGIYHENNFNNRGSEWERAIQLEYFDIKGNLELSQNLGIRIHGGANRELPQKSFRLVADSLYDDVGSMDFDFFDNASGHIYKSLLLRNSGNDNNITFFSDALMQTLVKDLRTFSTQDYKPTVVFINGEYYGIYNLRERYDSQYYKNHYGIEEKDLVVLKKNQELSIGNTKDLYHYRNMLEYIKNNDITQGEHLDYLKTQMDFSSFIDYFATEIFYGNADWPQNNIRFWRKTIDSFEEEAPYGHDGRWRWSMYDTDFGFYLRDEDWGEGRQPLTQYHNTIHWALAEFDGSLGTREWPNYLFRNLMLNLEFRNSFLVRFNDLINSYFKYDRIAELIDKMASNLENEMDFHIEKWGEIESKETWLDNIQNKYLFAKKRPDIIRRYIGEELDLEDVFSISLSNESEAGYIRLNGMDIVESLPGNDVDEDWRGAYFGGIPITLEAVARDGYEFSHWEGLKDTIGDSVITIIPDRDISIRAIFISK